MRLTLTALLLAAVATPALAAEPQMPHGYGSLALSAAGDRIATVESKVPFGPGEITIRSSRDGKVLQSFNPCAAACSLSGLTFASDGTLAWLARDRAAGTVTLALGKDGAARTVATVKGIAQTPRFSADGKRIALLVTIGAAKEAGAAQAGVRQVGEIGEKSDEQRLAVFDVGGAAVAADAVKPLSPADRYIYEYDWMPDGSGFVVTSALGNGDNNWWVATLDAVDAGTGAVRNIAKPKTQLNFPRVSPDGRTVAYIGGLMSDFGSVGGDVWTVPVAGGEPRNMTPASRLTVISLEWTDRVIRGTALRGDQAGLFAVGDRADGMGWSRPASLAAGDAKAAWSADGKTVATVVQDFTRAPAIFAGPVAAPVQITHDNDGIRPTLAARSITWTNDGFNVQGWLLSPLNADRGRKAPMITIVHGGPSAANVPSFGGGGAQSYLDAGYYVFLPNPRGSYGQGEAFTAANKRDFGGGDLRDILTGIDAVEKVAPVDDARLGLTGGSYGGFMAMWANTQTNRFKAIVAGAGLSNWVSYYGTNGIDQWMLPFFGKTLYEDRKAYEDVSAVNFIRQAKTPTFIYVGERDIEVPPTQSVEYWHGLKDNNVPTSLVIYPEEGHGIRGIANALDVRRRTLAWFDRYLGAGK